MKKLPGFVLSLLLLVSMLMGCGSSSSTNTESTAVVTTAEATATSAPAPKEVSIIVGDRVPDETGMNKWTAQRQKEFEKAFPHIKVKHIDNPQVDELKYVQSLTTILIAQDAPALVNVSATNYAKDLYNAELIAPIDDFIKEWEDWSDIYPNIINAFKASDGKTICFPARVDIPALGFNKTVLTEAGIDPTTLKIDTWDQMKDIVKKLNKDDIKGFGLNLTDYFLWWNNWNMANGSDTAVQNADGTITLNFGSQKTIDTVNFFRDLYKDGLSTKNVSLDLTAFLGDVWKGKTACSTYYPTWASWWKDSGLPPENMLIMPFPKGPSGDYGSAIFPAGYVINVKRPIEEQKAAIEYLKFISGIDAIKSYLQYAQDNSIVLVNLPVFKSIDFTQYKTGTPSDWLIPIQQIMENGKVLDIQSTAWTNYIVAILPKLVTDSNVDVVEELKKAQATAEKEWLNDFNSDHKK